MADISNLKTLMDTYGVGVRAGVLTPCTEDEVYFRSVMGLPVMSKDVLDSWISSNNTRHPITIKSGVGEVQDNVEDVNVPVNEDTQGEV